MDSPILQPFSEKRTNFVQIWETFSEKLYNHQRDLKNELFFFNKTPRSDDLFEISSQRFEA